MNQGPPCPNCGSLLRWYSEQQQWGCDTCRVMYPPQVMVHPQDYATSATVKKQRRAHSPAKRWRALPLAIAGLIVAGAGVGVAYLVFHKTKHTTGGYADRDTAVKETFRALGAGELDPLMAHAGAGLAGSIVDCEEGKQPTADDEKHDIEDMRQELSRAVERDKGQSYEVTKISEPSPAKTKAKGESLMRGCKLTTDITAHQLEVGLKITRGTKVSESDAKITVTEVAGQFFVMNTPKLGGCDGSVARIALVAGTDTGAAELAKRLEVPLVAACVDDKWAPKVLECTSHALGLKDVKSCFTDLEPAQRAHLRTAIGPLDGSTAALAMAGMVPGEADIPAKPDDPSITLGTPEPLGLADFWGTSRSDGSYLVTSPILTAVFPAKPETSVTRTTATADADAVDLYKISTKLQSGAEYDLLVSPAGKAIITGPGASDGTKELQALAGPQGKVNKAERTEDGQVITRLTATNGPKTFVIDRRVDVTRGLIIVALADASASATAFLASIHVGASKAVVDDPDILSGVRQRKAPKNKFVIHDRDDSFTLELPVSTKIERTVDATAHTVVVTATAAKKRAPALLTITEFSAWDALALSPAKLAELNAIKKQHVVWNAFQHRLYRFVCTDLPCEPIVKSLHFTDPQPVK